MKGLVACTIVSAGALLHTDDIPWGRATGAVCLLGSRRYALGFW